MIIKKIIKCRDKSRALMTTNTEFPVRLYNGRKLLTNIIKSSTKDVMWFLYAPLKRLIHHLT